MIVTAILGFHGFFIVRKKDTFFVDKVIPYFKKLSPMRKLILGIFTVFSAIPNKFWVNVRLHFKFVFIISSLIYVLNLFFSLLSFCYVMYIIFCLESLIFAILYEYSTYFKKLINSLLFGNYTDFFVADYFEWFWVNTWKEGAKKIGSCPWRGSSS